jgi:hypothetical protein
LTRLVRPRGNRPVGGTSMIGRVFKLITRPRMCSGTRVCRRVIVVVAAKVWPTPQRGSPGGRTFRLRVLLKRALVMKIKIFPPIRRASIVRSTLPTVIRALCAVRFGRRGWHFGGGRRNSMEIITRCFFDFCMENVMLRHPRNRRVNCLLLPRRVANGRHVFRTRQARWARTR